MSVRPAPPSYQICATPTRPKRSPSCETASASWCTRSMPIREIPRSRDPEIIAHAQLLFDGQMVMLSSAQSSEFAKAAPMLTVAQAGGNTQSL